MKFATVSKILVLGLALVTASTAFAATKASLILANPTKVSGTTLNAGKYILEWEGSGPNVEVSVMQGKTVLTKLQAKLVKSPLGLAAISTKKDAEGNTVLTGVQFDGKTFALELSESNNSVESASASK